MKIRRLFAAIVVFFSVAFCYSTKIVSEQAPDVPREPITNDKSFPLYAIPYAFVEGGNIFGCLLCGWTDIFDNNSSVSFNGQFSENLKNIYGEFIYPPVNAKRPGFQVSAYYGEDIKKFSLTEDNDRNYCYFTKKGYEFDLAFLGKYFYGRLDAKCSIGYKRYALERLDIYVDGLGLYNFFSDENTDEELNNIYHMFYFNLGGKIAFQRTIKKFISEKYFLGKMQAGLVNGGDFILSGDFQLKLQFPIDKVDFLRFYGGIMGYTQTENIIFHNKSAVSVGLSILNPKFVFKNILGFEAGAEILVFNFDFAKLSFYGSYEIAAYKNGNLNSTYNQGVAFGFMYYNSGNAIPSGYISVSYNFDKNIPLFYAGVGLVL